jgi:glycosyltransferase involved in cell wall biosynthesis
LSLDDASRQSWSDTDVHILYLIDSLAEGGAEQSLASLAPHFVSAGIRLDVAYLSERSGVQSRLAEAGVELFSLGTDRHRVRSIRLVRRLLSERAPDLLHTTLFEADVAGRLAGSLAWLPVVSSLVNVGYGPAQLSDPRLSAWKVRGAQLLDAITARSVVRFHAVSHHVAKVMAHRLMIPRSRVEVVPRGRDASQLGTRSETRRAAARTALNIDPATPLVLAVARQEYQKGLDILVRAMPRVLETLPDARLLVAGREGNLTPTLREDVGRLGLGGTVHFLGARQDVPELLCGADVFAAPSRWEGMPGTVIEAMALEAPIVASDIPTVREVVGSGAPALLVRPGDADALAMAIVAALSEPAAAAERAHLGRARFLERFTQEAAAAAMIDFYEGALTRTRRRGQ